MLGGVMGFTPSQVREMTIQDFEIIAEGYRLANGGKKAAETMSDDELRELGIEV